MPKKNKISILDVTVRDGSYAIDYQYTPAQVAAVAGALDAAGIDYAEVSHGCGLGAAENLGYASAATDAEYVRAAKGAVRKTKVGVIAGPEPVTTRRDIDSVIRDVDFIRFAANCDDPGAVEAHATYTLRLRPRLPLFLQLMRSTRRQKKELVAAGRQAEAMGFAAVYIVDTAGHFTPDETGDVIAALAAKLRIAVGFHGHDNLNLAVANTIAAVDAGATSVDASLKGIGRAGGNAQLECLVAALKRRGLLRKIDLEKLIEAGESLVKPIMPPRHGAAAIDLRTAVANVDLPPLGIADRIAAAAGMPLARIIASLGRGASAVEIGPRDFWRALQKLGARPSEVFAKAGLSAPLPAPPPARRR